MTVGQTIDALIRVKDNYRSSMTQMEIEAINNVCNLLEHNYTNDTCIRDTIKNGYATKKIDYKDKNWMFNKLEEHVGHSIECVRYGPSDNPVDICIECTECNHVLVSAEDYDEEE